MKKLKIISLFILLTFTTQANTQETKNLFTSKNTDSLINKKTVSKIQFWTWLFAFIDQVVPENYKQWSGYKIPNFNFQVTPQQLKLNNIDSLKDLSLNIHAPSYVNNILLSSLEYNEGIIPIVLNAWVKAYKLEENIKGKISTLENPPNLENFQLKESLITISEKICENLSNSTLNKTIKKNRILKRFIKVLLFTGIATGGTYVRQELTSTDLKEYMPKVTTTAVEKFVGTFICEIIAELLQRHVIGDPVKQKMETIKQKHEAMLAQLKTNFPPQNQIKSYQVKLKKAEN